jgi:hypothetical protein
MDAETKMGRKRFELASRYAITIECADNLTDQERAILDAWFETEVNLLQRRERRYTDEQAAQWEAEALGIDAPTLEATGDA